MQRRLGASFVFLSLGLVALVQAPGPHPPDQGHHDQRCVDAFECHCDPHAPDNMPVCEGGHCSCHHVHLCAHNHECHCDPPSPDKIPTCTDGQCTCQHTGILDADRCTHDDECHHHCEPPGPDHKPVCMDGHCSCHHTGLICPECDANLKCVWNHSCYPGEVCMLRQYHMDPFTVHCSKKQDCLFMKRNMNGTEILCCEDHQCITDIIP
uniref:Uncharacterized protein n=1 Tax=Magallana gigas TaxID=29159 RepID=A0A8W8MXK6_MAGGI